MKMRTMVKHEKGQKELKRKQRDKTRKIRLKRIKQKERIKKYGKNNTESQTAHM